MVIDIRGKRYDFEILAKDMIIKITPFQKFFYLCLLLLILIFSSGGESSAISSPNFQIPYHDLGPSREIESVSSNFKLESFIGDIFRGKSGNTTYQAEHGFFYLKEAIFLNLKVLPEMRIPPTYNFWTRLAVEVRNPGKTIPLISQTINTNSGGLYFNLLLTGISPGTYDITTKGCSHLRSKKENVVLIAGSNFVDFSNEETDYLLAGDVNGINGDNLINSIDIAVEVIKLDQSVNVEREDLNLDGIVNSLDLAIIIKNLDIWGDS